MYAIGEQDVTDEVAASALACGYAASAKKLKDETPETEAPATEKVPSAKREKRK
jgi:hypothetical protein